MKKLLASVLLAAGMVSCAGTAEKTIPVYGWQGEGAEATEASIQADFSKWKEHGLCGVCYNAGGFNVEKHARAAKIAHANGLEYHAWIPAMLKGDADSTAMKNTAAQNREASATVSTRFAAAMRRAFFRAICSLPVSG